MRKLLISAVSLAALTAGGIAYAQDSNTTTTQPPATEQPAQSGSGTMTEPNAAQPGDSSSTTTVLPKTTEENAQTDQPATTDPNQAQTTTDQPATADPNQAQTTTDQPATTDQAQTTDSMPSSSSFTISGLEAGNVFMASTLIGSTVYTAANENIGDINDVVIAKDGKVLAYVIGVGGFLGLGEKDVAVPMDRLQFGRDENNNMKFTISASKEELEQAPAFDRTKLIVGGEPTTTSP